MANPHLIPLAFAAYRDLLPILFTPATALDLLDNRLIANIPPTLSPSLPHSPALLPALLAFPQIAQPALHGPLMLRPYTLLTLLALHGDPLLLYALLSRGVSVKDFDWSRANELSPDAQNILRAATRDERAQRELKIPPDVQDALRAAAHCPQPDPPLTPRPASPSPGQSLKRARAASQPRCESPQQRPQPGILVNGFFVEDYDDGVDDRVLDPVHQVPSPLAQLNPPKPANRPLDPAHQNKRARLALLSSSLNVPPRGPPPPPPPQPPPSEPAASIPNGPPYTVQLSHIPKNATRESIEVFLQVGADAFKLANKQNHRLDALGRSVHKYKPGFNGFAHIRAKFPKIEDRTRLLIKNDISDRDQTAWMIFDSLEQAELVIKEFNGRRYLYHDTIAPKLSCQFVERVQQLL